MGIILFVLSLCSKISYISSSTRPLLLVQLFIWNNSCVHLCHIIFHFCFFSILPFFWYAFTEYLSINVVLKVKSQKDIFRTVVSCPLQSTSISAPSFPPHSYLHSVGNQWVSRLPFWCFYLHKYTDISVVVVFFIPALLFLTQMVTYSRLLFCTFLFSPKIYPGNHYRFRDLVHFL